nr:uncharacterized protein LOC101105501 [Ovis aries]
MRVWKTGHRKEKGNFPRLLLSQKNSVPKWTSPGGLTQLKTDPQCSKDLNHEEGFLLPSTPPLSNPIIENSLPTGAISKGTCRTEVEASYCRGSPRIWTQPQV